MQLFQTLRLIPVWSYNDNTKNVNIFPSLERSDSLVLLHVFFHLLVFLDIPKKVQLFPTILIKPLTFFQTYRGGWLHTGDGSGWRDLCCKPCRGFYAFISLLRFMFYCADNCICVLLSWLHRYGLSHSGRLKGNFTVCHRAGKITQGHVPVEAAGFYSSSYLFSSPSLVPPVLHSYLNVCGTFPARSS